MPIGVFQIFTLPRIQDSAMNGQNITQILEDRIRSNPKSLLFARLADEYLSTEHLLIAIADEKRRRDVRTRYAF